MPQPAGNSLIYRRLARRNRMVGVLRFVVPLFGALVLGGLIGQIYLASIGGQFGIAQLSVSPESITIEAPEYVGALADGSSYRVWAEQAEAATESSDLIDLANARLVIDRIDGVQLTMEAISAQLDTTNQLTLVSGVADVADSTGTTGTLVDSVFDWQAQTLTTRGRVVIDYADGSGVRAAGLVYDAANVIWTFEQSVVTLPSTPGEDQPDAGGNQPE
jgi:lipopolysaccharide export system protein LptC